MIRPQMTDLQLKILNLVYRLQVATLHALRTLLDDDGLEEAVTDLESNAYLNRVRLFDKTWCYQLTERYALEVDPRSEAHKPLIRSQLTRAYARMQFFVNTPSREPLAKIDFLNTPYASPGMRHRDYYATDIGIGHFVLDRGRESTWNRLLLKLTRRVIGRHRKLLAYATLILQGRFELGVVTAYSSKADRLRTEVNRHKLFERIPVVVQVVPEILAF